MGLRVCKLTNVHSPLDPRIYYKQAMSLAEAGYEVTIIGPGAPELAGERGGVRIETIPRARSLSQRLLNIVRLLKRSLRANADIYHFHDAELLLLGVVLWLRGKKVIYDVHEHFPQVAHVRPWVPDGLRRPLSILVDAGEQWLSRCLSAVVGVVEEQGSRFERRPFAAVKNYPRMELFAGNGRSASGMGCELVHVGSLSTERGGIFLLEIMRVLGQTHPAVRLLSQGKFHSANIEKLFLQKLEEYGLEERVVCRSDPVPYEQLGELIRESRVGLIPGQVSLKNLRPFVPTKLFEYLACGIPVVASALPSIRAFHAEADWGILVEPADARAHARAIGFLLDHPAVAREKGERGQIMVEDRFNWAGEAQKLLALYDRVFTPERKGK